MTGTFAARGKLACWKAFLEAGKDAFIALADLRTTVQAISTAIAVIEI